MRLGKKKEKEKENEPKSQNVEGVTRLICSAKTHVPLKGTQFLVNYKKACSFLFSIKCYCIIIIILFLFKNSNHRWN